MNIIFTVFPIFFFMVFGFIILVIVKAAKQSQAYKKEPRVTAYAKVLEKRDHVSNGYSHYYATFEFKTGDRIELRIPHDRTGLLVEGDEGDLTFQGDMFIDFGNEIY